MIESVGVWCGTLAAIIATFSFFPQAYKAWKTQSVTDLSWGWVSMFCFSNSLWVVYGIVFTLWPIIIANLLILLCMAYIVFVKIRTELLNDEKLV